LREENLLHVEPSLGSVEDDLPHGQILGGEDLDPRLRERNASAALAAMRTAGASGYLRKDHVPEELA